ncbi:nicotinate (nicotinamide) nucleotide adenylyltransferase [Sulfurimonas sp. C5]|uniref:nicotinate (nicotinamide) nucleotide adenylyltransferase n=1 Tax=Sulfurimonas sp. C5 TaxID=3036947 RepID=UPI002458A6C8|nr:nicotinate (nicotinamide) nucleotide adenylyltransferase [Sulfurimonas sp. C5]MDH4945215.1 nicotinate (nicotinamide) nucleotide adenylyltransferase [Sulfurimonas sp. C5]
MKNIALFGGSFDPPHIGHIKIVEALRDLDFIDKVVIMPTYLNPFKSKFIADAHLRLKWLKDIFQDYQNIEVSSFEVEQQKKVPTIDTVKYLQQFYKDIYVVIGADNLASLEKWYKYDELVKLVKFIIVTREETHISDDYIQLNVDVPISSTQLRKDCELKFLPPKIADEILKYYKEYNDK